MGRCQDAYSLLCNALLMLNGNSAEAAASLEAQQQQKELHDCIAEYNTPRNSSPHSNTSRGGDDGVDDRHSARFARSRAFAGPQHAHRQVPGLRAAPWWSAADLLDCLVGCRIERKAIVRPFSCDRAPHWYW